MGTLLAGTDSRAELIQRLQMERYIAALAREADCSGPDMQRVLRVLDEHMDGWTTYCLRKYWRPQGISWHEHQMEHRADLHDLVLTTMLRWTARELKASPDIDHDTLCIRACGVLRRAAARNIAQTFYQKISSCGHWSMTLTPGGEVRYRDSDLRVSVNENESTWESVESLQSIEDPCDLIEAYEEHQSRVQVLDLVLERLRKEYTQRQVAILMMCLRDRMTEEEIAAALGENKRNIVRCLERMRPRAAAVAADLQRSLN